MWRANRYLPFEILEAVWTGQGPQETGGARFYLVHLQ